MSVSRAGSGKGLPREPTKDATAPPRSEPIGQLGTGNDPQLRGGVWDWHRGKGNVLHWPQECTCRDPLGEAAAKCPWGGWEAGIVLASIGLCLPSQALGLALGIMPAECREESLTHP